MIIIDDCSNTSELVVSSVGNRLDYHNRSSVLAKPIGCIISSWDAILKVFSHVHWDEGVISVVTLLGIGVARYLKSRCDTYRDT